MFFSSSKRAFSSTRTATCLPFSAARMSAGRIAESGFVRYSVILIATVFESTEARSIISTTGENESYGWWRRMSPARIAAKTDVSGWLKTAGTAGEKGGSFSSRPVEPRERHEVARAERPVHLVDLVLGDLELLLEELSHALGRLRGDLEAHDRAEAAAPHLLLDRGEEVGGLVLLDLDVGVARHAEEVRRDDLETGKELARDSPG